MKDKNTKYTYYRMDFKDCPNFPGDYTIVETIKEISKLIELVDSDLDDPDCDAVIEIRGVSMTTDEFNKLEENA